MTDTWTDPGQVLLRSRINVVPSAYRGVSVTHSTDSFTWESLTAHFTGREVYRRTRFLVVHEPNGVWLATVQRADPVPLFSPVTSVEILADPTECTFVTDASIDTAIPSNLARAAANHAPEAKAVVVEGLYSHISFILNPQPLNIHVTEVIPPTPAKLFDQVRRLLEVAEDLPPIVAHLDALTLDSFGSTIPSGHYLLPCRGSDTEIIGARTSYLDQRPDREDWTMVGCERSAQIHEWFFGDRPPMVSFCPREREGSSGTATITKCCLLEESIEIENGRVVVPWGASLVDIREAINELARTWDPTWTTV